MASRQAVFYYWDMERHLGSNTDQISQIPQPRPGVGWPELPESQSKPFQERATALGRGRGRIHPRINVTTAATAMLRISAPSPT